MRTQQSPEIILLSNEKCKPLENSASAKRMLRSTNKNGFCPSTFSAKKAPIFVYHESCKKNKKEVERPRVTAISLQDSNSSKGGQKDLLQLKISNGPFEAN